MKRVCLSSMVVAMILVCSVSAKAGEGAIDSNKLAAMGLGNAMVVSDEVSQSVRGHGFALAAGGSFAGVISDQGAAAGSLNVYLGVGKHFAAGANGSAAGKTVSHTKVVKVLGVPVSSTTNTRSIHVYAGGFSGAVAF